MSEQAPRGPEQKTSVENSVERPERTEHRHTNEREPDDSNKAELEQTIEKLRSTVKHEAVSGKDVSVEKSGKNTSEGTSPFVNHELKQLMFKRTLTHVQKQLSAPGRALSKIVHAPAVESVSNLSEKTIARPKGFMVGSIVAFVGSAYTLYAAKHYGFRYNVLLFLILFMAGYIVTTFVELVTLKARRRSH